MAGVGLETNVNLIVATLDLQLVRLLRGAIRAADQGAAASGAAGVPSPAATFAPRPVLHPESRYEPRPVLHPAPRYEPRVIERPLKVCPDVIPLCSAPCAPERPHHLTPSPIQPPWKTLPWQNVAQTSQVVKVVYLHPDNVGKRSILDCFI